MRLEDILPACLGRRASYLAGKRQAGCLTSKIKLKALEMSECILIFSPGELFLNDPLIAGIVNAEFLEAVK
jgi:hypothetical protein